LLTADYDFTLPPERIASAPAETRDGARLLVTDRHLGSCKHTRFSAVLEHLPPRALIVLNDTRVFPARLTGRKPTGGAVEFLLTRRVSPPARAEATFDERWEALARNIGRAEEGAPRAIPVGGGAEVTVLERRSAGSVLVRLTGPGPSSFALLETIGRVPLPPYIEAARRRMGTAAPIVDDRERYQTVYAASPGAVAAPTAGLHFTPALLDAARAAGHEIVSVTLHVGPGTFRPVETTDPREHRLDAERYQISPAAAEAIASARAAGRPVMAVGTTVVRTLEGAARAHGGTVPAGDGETDICLLPGDRFEVVTDLLTNFHLPRSTLLMLVSAFAGRERVLDAYREAVELGYRFYSYGDAMLIQGERP